MLSAYRDKVQPDFLDRVIPGLQYRNIKDCFRKLPDFVDPEEEDQLKQLKTELDLYSFRMFVYYLLQEGLYRGVGGTKKRHYHRYYDLCRMCSIDWDFIGKMESIEEDSEHIMEVAGVKGQISLGLKAKSNDNTKLITYFKGLPVKIVVELYNLYIEDFHIFGYQIQDWLWEHLDPVYD